MTLCRHSQGYALVSVLWGVAILSLIVSAMMLAGNTSYMRARNASIEAEIEALAEAGLNRAVYGLVDPDQQARWRIDGVPIPWVFQGTEMQVRIEDELGKIDINTADVSLLSSLFRAAGETPARADSIANRIADWRDSDDLRRLNGAEAQDYEEAGRLYRPRNAAFPAKSELMLVLGMTEPLFAAIEPSVTVYSRRPSFNRATAPQLALMATGGMTEDTVELQLANRLRSLSPPVLPIGINTGTGRAFTISIEIDHRGRKRTWNAVIILTGDNKRPFLRLE